MTGLLLAVVRRDLLLARRRRIEALLPLGFFIVAAGLFPIGVGPEPQTLRQIAPGVVWVCALLAAMLSVTQMFASDHQDGSLEQMLLAPQPLVAIVGGKVLAHWLSSGLPLVLAAPLIGLLFGMQAPAIGTLTLRCCWARRSSACWAPWALRSRWACAAARRWCFCWCCR